MTKLYPHNMIDVVARKNRYSTRRFTQRLVVLSARETTKWRAVFTATRRAMAIFTDKHHQFHSYDAPHHARKLLCFLIKIDAWQHETYYGGRVW